MPAWAWAAVVLVGLNVFSFLLFAEDKRRARSGAWRISEAALLVSAGVCGTFGAWYAVFRLHHKSKKTSFLVKLGLVSLVDLGVFVLVVPRVT